MGNRFASARIAIAMCDVCGFQYKLKVLKDLVVKGRNTNIKACPECWNPDQPQLRLGVFPVEDPQAIRNPRPDFTGYPQSRAHIEPVDQLVAFGHIGVVTIVIT